MSDIVGFLVIAVAVVLILMSAAILQTLHKIEQKLSVQGSSLSTILRAINSTQNEVRNRRKSVGVEPILDKPKAAQHYEGRGIKRVARGGKTDPASGESATARIGEVKRRSYGGTSGDPRSS